MCVAVVPVSTVLLALDIRLSSAAAYHANISTSTGGNENRCLVPGSRAVVPYLSPSVRMSFPHYSKMICFSRQVFQIKSI